MNKWANNCLRRKSIRQKTVRQNLIYWLATLLWSNMGFSRFAFQFFSQNHALVFWNGSLAEEFAIAFWSLLCHRGNGCRALSPSFPFHSSSLCSSHLPLISSLILRLVLVVTSMEVACNLLLLYLDSNIVNHRVGKDVEPNVFGVRNWRLSVQRNGAKSSLIQAIWCPERQQSTF